MRTLGMTVRQYQQAFRTDGQCMKYLFERKYPEGFHCSRCGHDRHYFVNHRGGCFQCERCRYMESAKAGTLFHRSKIPLRKWFAGILEFTISKGGISAVELQRRLGFGCYETAWQMLHKLRMAMASRDQDYQLKNLVELDGVHIGKQRKGGTGTLNKFYLAVEEQSVPGKRRKAGFAHLVKVDFFTAASAQHFVEAKIAPGTHVKTDGNHNFQGALKELPVHHDAQLMYELKHRLEKHLPWVFRLTSNMKGKLWGIYHGVSPKYVERYLAEYLYRFNRRWCIDQLQTRLVTACLASGPITYADVTR